MKTILSVSMVDPRPPSYSQQCPPSEVKSLNTQVHQYKACALWGFYILQSSLRGANNAVVSTPVICDHSDFEIFSSISSKIFIAQATVTLVQKQTLVAHYCGLHRNAYISPPFTFPNNTFLHRLPGQHSEVLAQEMAQSVSPLRGIDAARTANWMARMMEKRIICEMWFRISKINLTWEGKMTTTCCMLSVICRTYLSKIPLQTGGIIIASWLPTYLKFNSSLLVEEHRNMVISSSITLDMAYDT